MEGTRAAGRRPFMPASRILEGSLPVQHPSGHIFFGGATTTRNGVRAGYQGRSPWLVRSLPRGNGGLGDAALPICLAPTELNSGQPAAKTAASFVLSTYPAHRERPLGIDPRR